MIIKGNKFTLIGAVKPKLCSDGLIWTDKPQARSRRHPPKEPHAYGSGLFCSFRFADAPKSSGVFLIVRSKKVLYVGEAQDLRTRLNPQLGHIAPSDCYEGGQQTNCRINGLILRTLHDGGRVEIWFCPCEDRGRMKAEIMPAPQPEWNLQLGRAGS